ncbi:MAG: hypothetical protein JWN78_2125 [Bacteroidota bacterium]|nr:hypothetical protein [Bacteroidota bacterium]
MQKIITVIIITICAISIYSCKKTSTTTTTPVVTIDPADSFIGTWNAIDTSYYFTVPTDFRNFNFSVIKTDSNKVSLIGFPNSGDTTHGTVTINSMTTDDSTLVIQGANPRVITYRFAPGTFPILDYYFLGKARKL